MEGWAMEMSNKFTKPDPPSPENSAAGVTMDVCQSGIPRRILLRTGDGTKKNLEKSLESLETLLGLSTINGGAPKWIVFKGKLH